MPLRAVLYQADDNNLYSFFGGGVCEDDPFRFLNSQTQNCNYVDLNPSYMEKKGNLKVWPRRRRGDDEFMRRQRQTHMAVERNRRKQVNEYLSVIRSIMPHSYANKGDQASIIGGAINFVKELEQKLQCHNHINSNPFSHFFSSSSHGNADVEQQPEMNNNAADVEVSVAECFANLKIRAIQAVKKQQLLVRILEHLDECKLTVLHLNICRAEQIVLYTICMKVEDESKLTSGDEIAASVRQLFYLVCATK